LRLEETMTETDTLETTAPPKRRRTPVAVRLAEDEPATRLVNKREHFIEVAERRMQTALRAMNAIAKMGGNKGSYEYGPSDVEAITKTLDAAITNINDRLARKPKQLLMFQLPRERNGGA
jgi:hypothetical protein